MQDEEPEIKCYSVDHVVVGIDITSGYFQVESQDTEKKASIYDDLFVYRGLDSDDLKITFTWKFRFDKTVQAMSGR